MLIKESSGVGLEVPKRQEESLEIIIQKEELTNPETGAGNLVLSFPGFKSGACDEPGESQVLVEYCEGKINVRVWNNPEMKGEQVF